MRKIVSAILAAVLLMSLSGCAQTAKTSTTSKTATTSSAKKDIKDIKIGVTFQGLSDAFIVRLSNSFEKEAKSKGVQLSIGDGKMDAATQVSQVENFIAQKVDVIIIDPISSSGCAPAVDDAIAAGIPIITLIQTTSNQTKATAYVGSDAVESGKIETQMLVKDLGGKGNIVVMDGQMGGDAQIGRDNGMKSTLQGTQIKILAEQTANWDREQAVKLMENWITSHSNIDAVLAQNDEMALGAVQVIKEKNLAGKIKVYGIDAEAEALTDVSSGIMEGTVFQNAEEQGKECVDVAINCAQGQKLNADYYIPYEGVRAADVPTYKAKLGIK